MKKKTIVFDFDGVIHKYSKGYQGESIYDEPNQNVIKVINQLRYMNYEVVIVSTRCNTLQGIEAIKMWLDKYNIIVDKVCKEKPPALVYIDDRAIKFDPKADNLLDQIINFQPNIKLYEKYSKLNEFDLLLTLKARNEKFIELNNKFDKISKDNPIKSLMLIDLWIEALERYIQETEGGNNNE